MNTSVETILLYTIAAGFLSIVYGYFTGKNILSYSLKVILHGKAVTVSKNSNLNADGIKILGYYNSPLEDRILIVLEYTNWGCSEFDHESNIIMVGCELNPKWWE